MKKFLMPFFLLGALSVGFTSCGSDDDDDTPVVAFAKVSYSVNGEESPKEITLKRGTISSKEGTVGTDDMIKLSLSTGDNSKIKKVQITVNNSYEYNVPVVDELGQVFDDKFVYETPSTEKKINFVGVYGKYTIKVTTDKGTYNVISLNVVNDKENSTYNGAGSTSNRYLCNKQTVVLDASGKTHSKSFNTNALIALTYNATKEGGVEDYNFGNASIRAISENDYENLQGSKGDFYLTADSYKDFGKPSISEKTEYFVYKCGEIYYLIHILKLDGNTIKFDIQY